MTIVIPVAEQKRRLQEFLTNLSSLIVEETITSESHLETFVQVESQAQIELQLGRGFEKTPANATLLELLNYRYEDVENHPIRRVIIGRVKYAPDYILRRKNRPCAIVDLKAPGVNIDHPTWKAQIYNYCRDEGLPIGVLFNGVSLRVFINPHYRGLTKYGETFKGEPVAGADEGEARQMIDLLLKLSADAPEENPVVMGRLLANKRLREIRSREWRRGIEESLKGVLSNPTDETLQALASLSIWTEPKPTGENLVAIWKEYKDRPVPAAKRKRSAANKEQERQ